jgi:hypothetical protein
LLTDDQLKLVLQAERRENLRTCLTGRYPALCDHSKLSGSELKSVREAEKQENIRVCLSGRYPSLCNHSLLSPEEAERVRSAEKAENLKVCMDGRYPALCNRTLLTPEQAKSADAAEAKAQLVSPALRAKPRSEHSLSRESGVEASRGDVYSGVGGGHWISETSSDGGIITLEDGSLWEIYDIDRVDTALWLPITDITVLRSRSPVGEYKYLLINKDDDEKALAKYLGTE